jgi:hypothetical protein
VQLALGQVVHNVRQFGVGKCCCENFLVDRAQEQKSGDTRRSKMRHRAIGGKLS